MKFTRTAIPSLFTALNIFCGFLSLVFSGQGQFAVAAWLIILAAVFDSLDGIMARLTHTSSQFGVELDSLADVVSFGAAPSFLVYQVYLQTFQPWGIVFAAFPVVLGAIRLARFNVQLVGFDKDYFNGLPIPMQAITICAFILQYNGGNGGISGVAGIELTVLVIVLSLLMVSTIKYDTMPKLTKEQLKLHSRKSVILGMGAFIVVIAKVAGGMNVLFEMLVLYILFGLCRTAMLWLKKMVAKANDDPADSGKLSSIDI
jgi:CDP-diacylglycerol---serine O-phosphatidyltransferase